MIKINFVVFRNIYGYKVCQEGKLSDVLRREGERQKTQSTDGDKCNEIYSLNAQNVIMKQLNISAY